MSDNDTNDFHNRELGEGLTDLEVCPWFNLMSKTNGDVMRKCPNNSRTSRCPGFTRVTCMCVCLQIIVIIMTNEV